MRFSRCLYLSLVLGFILGIQDGFITLWEDGKSGPAAVFPYSAASLPEQDRKALERGIPVENARALQEYLEDFLS